jgi:hypothetical protein
MTLNLQHENGLGLLLYCERLGAASQLETFLSYKRSLLRSFGGEGPRFVLPRNASELPRENFPGKTFQENFPGNPFHGKLSRENGKREKSSPKAFTGEAECDEDCYPWP